MTGIEEAKRLGQQRVMQVQSGIDPPKKVAQGERQIGADGDEYFTLQTRDQGGRIEPVYPTEGTPSIPSGAGVIVDAPHPNAAQAGRQGRPDHRLEPRYRLATAKAFAAEGCRLMLSARSARPRS